MLSTTGVVATGFLILVHDKGGWDSRAALRIEQIVRRFQMPCDKNTRDDAKRLLWTHPAGALARHFEAYGEVEGDGLLF